MFGFLQQSLNLTGANAVEMAEHIEDIEIQFCTAAVEIADFLHRLRQRAWCGEIADLALCNSVTARDFRSQFNGHLNTSKAQTFFVSPCGRRR
ncbi:hypothetical protein [Mesorhizobium sp. 1M-11]|uniref:hypothetical protein n=1 Tax=Mesorhizobium sp. 1M-11 TaxID=1529006 RepID=UPI001AEBFCC0|nr:hypothetical protein [Mesorhizobium sp. 1M-11]